MTIEVKAPFRLIEKKKDETRIKVAVKCPPQALIIRLDIDPNDAKNANDLFTLTSTDGKVKIVKSVNDDHTPGDKFVDLLFEGLDPMLSWSLELDPRPGAKRFLFENIPYGQLAGVIHKMPPEPAPSPAGDGDLRIRVDIDPADAKEANDEFRLTSDGGYESKKSLKDDQVAGDKFVDLHFEDLPKDQLYTLEINGHVSFSHMSYGELAHLSGDHPPDDHHEDAGEGDFRIRIDIDPADLAEASDTFTLRGKSGYEQKKTLKDDQQPGDAFVDLHFTGIPKTELLTLEIHDSKSTHVAFQDVAWTELAGLSGEPDPDIEIEPMRDQNKVPDHISPEELA